MDIQELKDLIDQNIIDNSKRISSTKTTASMLKQVLSEIVNSLEDSKSQSSDERYHTKIYGEIKLFYGNYYSLPKGWVICDGFNGTPDMRGKVPVGWSNGWSSALGESDLSDYQHIGRMGGFREVFLEVDQLPSHNHGGSSTTSSSGEHTHTVRGNFVTHSGDDDRDTSGSGYGEQNRTDPAGVHTHNFVIPSEGSNLPHENRQPYMVMMFIMYTGNTVASTQEKVSWSEYDSTTGVKIVEGDSNHKYGFRYVAPANFGSSDPSDYNPINQTGDIISNLGFIPETDMARPLEMWLQLVSLGDNLGDDN